MDIDRAVVKVADYLSNNLGMGNVTAKMASRRYIKSYLGEIGKAELMAKDLPAFSKWLATRFENSGMIMEERIQKMINDFDYLME